MRIQTQGNTNKVWLSNETGVIEGTMTLSATPLEKILQAINEKYGTSFESWSQLPTVYEVGGTVPNWDAYEKIFLSLDEGLYKFDVTEGSMAAFAAMKFQNGTMQIYASETGVGLKINIYNPQGVFQGPGGDDRIVSAVQQICAIYSNVQAVEKVLKDTNNLDNFDNYTLLS